MDLNSVIVCGRTGEELVRLHSGQNHEHVYIHQIPLHVQHAFIAIEDERFFEHNGIDIRGIGRATHRLVTSGGTVTEGASTITQQLIKNMLGRFESNFVYKLQEQYMAINFERFLTDEYGCRMYAKGVILEAYLNIINLGRTNQGVQAAARFYYNVDVWDLTIAQAATIAAIAQNPTRFPPDTRPEANWVRAQHVLDSMLRLEFITEEEHYEAINSDVYSTIYRLDGGDTRPLISPFDCFTDALINSVRNDLMEKFNLTYRQASQMIHSGGLRIYTTQIPEMQAAVDRVFLDDFYWPESDFSIDIEFNFTLYNTVTNQTRPMQRRRNVPNMEAAEEWIAQTLNHYMTAQDELRSEQALFTPQPQAAFVLLDHSTGHVVALRGVRGERGTNRSFNRATQATRSPGSQLKPIGVFGPAYDLGIMTPGTVIVCQPFTYRDRWGGAPWSPTNHGGWPGFLGPVTTRTAIYRSGNVVSARAVGDYTIPHLGVETMFAYLRNLGISTIVDGQDWLAVSLGGMHRGVHLIELAGAYGAYANSGLFNRPVLYSLVLGPNGEVVLENPVNPTRVVRDTAAYMLIDAMKDTMTATNATGHRANWHNAPDLRRDIPIAGKTGTSQENRDLGFSGSTPYFTASIWMGNDNNERMTRGAGGAHLIAWRSIMQEIHENLPPRQFDRPTEGRIVSGTVCRDSGLLATDLCRTDIRGSRTRTDMFDSRNLATEYCNIHVRITYCAEHWYAPGVFCNPVTRVGVAMPGVSGGFAQAVLDGITCPNCRPVQAPELPTSFPWDDPNQQTDGQQQTPPSGNLLQPPPIDNQLAPPPLVGGSQSEPDYDDYNDGYDNGGDD